AEPMRGHADERRDGTQIVARQREVAGGVRERGKQRRKLSFVERGTDLVVRLGDRLSGCDEGAGRGRLAGHLASLRASTDRRPDRYRARPSRPRRAEGMLTPLRRWRSLQAI